MPTKTKKKVQRTPFKGGSVHNYLMSNNATLPVVGKGATEMLYSDRRVYEVVKVSDDGKEVTLERLDTVADKTMPCEMGHQNWVHNPTGQFFTIVWRNGAWRNVVTQVIWDELFYANTMDKMVHGSESYKQIMNECWDDKNDTLKVIPGKTRIKMSYPKINILFGVKNYYYDWEF